MAVVFGARIKEARKAAGLTQQQLADILGVANTSISNWEKDLSRPGPDTIAGLCGALNVTPNYLLGTPTGFQAMPAMVELPLVGRIACGEPITAEENVEGYVSVPSAWRATFALICEGDSMEPTVHDGDLVAIRSQKTVENGEMAAVRIGGEATLKRVYLFKDKLILQPENRAYAPIVKIGTEMNEVSIEGRAVGLCRGL